MTPRPRKPGRRGLPDNLYVNKVGGQTYYRYRHPVTGRFHQMGKDFTAACRAARVLNAKLVAEAEGVGDTIERVLSAPVEVEPATPLCSDFMRTFRNDVLPNRINNKGRKLSSKTLYDYQNRIDRFLEQEFAKRPVGEVSRREIAAYLSPQPGRTQQANRGLLNQIFARAISDGYRDDSPVIGTERPVVVVERKRLQLSDYQTIYNHEETPQWLRNAMDLALQTLQRREEVAAFQFAHVRDGILYVNQQKVERHGTGYVAIEVGGELQAVIDRCRDELVSPYMIHFRPKRRVKSVWRTHWTQVHPDTVTDAFSEVRDNLKMYANLPPRKRPSFHEIRSLGADLYLEAGWSKEEVQALLGHADEKTTEHYLERNKIRWVHARAGLSTKTAG